MPYVALVIAVCCAAFWYAAGEQELGYGVLWAGLSLCISLPIILYFGAGTLTILLAQIGLLAGITLFRTWRDKDGF